MIAIQAFLTGMSFFFLGVSWAHPSTDTRVGNLIGAVISGLLAAASFS